MVAPDSPPQYFVVLGFDFSLQMMAANNWASTIYVW
jgi:hypothetical protein